MGQITIENNTITYEVNASSLVEGESISSERKKNDYDTSKVTNKKIKLDNINKLKITFSYDTFKKISFLWNNTFNDYTDITSKKTIESMMNMASIIETTKVFSFKKYEQKLAEELGKQYNTLSNKDISIEIDLSNDKLYQTDYYLVCYVKSTKIEYELVPYELYKNKTSKGNSFFVLELRLSQASTNNSSKDLPTHYFSGNFDVPILYKEMPFKNNTYNPNGNESLSDYFYNKIPIIIQKISNNYRGVYNAYRMISKEIITSLDTSNNPKGDDDAIYAVSLSPFSSNLLICFKITNYTEKDAYVSYGNIKIWHIYKTLLFPEFFNSVEGTNLKYYICKDDEQRTRYGFFSEEYLGNRDIDKDQPIKADDTFKEFKNFFIWDTDDGLDGIEATSEQIPCDKF